MSEASDLLALNTALSQAGRRLRAPAPGQAPVDGRSLAELIGFAAEYGALIRFYDLSNQPDGDWSAFFLNDPSVTLALCAGLDLPDIEAELGLLLTALAEARGADARLAYWAVLSRMLIRLANLLLSEPRADAVFLPLLAELVAELPGSELADQSQSLLRLCNGVAPERRLGQARPDPGWLGQFYGLLDEFAAALGAALELARARAIAQLAASLLDQDHPPQAGLWDAFVQLFGHAQNSLNRVPARLLDFYQRAVLRQHSRPATPDQVALCFSLADGVANTLLAQGTGFLAGSDASGQSIVYALDADLSVDAGSVTGLRTLTVVAQPLLPGWPALPSQVLSGVAALQPKPPEIATPFPLFGANAAGSQGALEQTLASLGFAVSSSCFLMAGGQRQVRLGLGFAPAELAALHAELAEIDAGTLPEILLALLLENAFALSYSSAGGWVDVAQYRVSPPAAPDAPYLLSFQLGADAAAWAPYPQTLGGGPGPYADAPTLSARLLQTPIALGPEGWSLYAYAWLSRLALSALSIEVNVGGLTELAVGGPSGPVDTSQAFAVFGSPPVQYASLSISAPELFAKQLSCFSASIAWTGLPVTSTGFRGYYEAYVINANGESVPPGSLFDNDSFKVGLDVVNPGRWALQASPADQLLFQCDYDSELAPPPLLPTSVLSKPTYARQPGPYYDPSQSYVNLRLDTPSYAFGDILYAPNVMAASLQLTATAAACAGKCVKPDRGEAAALRLEALGSAGQGGERAAAGQLDDAVRQAVADLDGAALEALGAAMAHAEFSAEQRAQWSASLDAALVQARGRRVLRWLGLRRDTGQRAVHGNLQQWLAAHADELAAVAPSEVAQAQALLDAGSGVLALRDKAAGLSPAAARTVLAGGVRSLQEGLRRAAHETCEECIQKCLAPPSPSSFPNQPWLPMAKSLSVNYTARAQLPLATDQDSCYHYLCPFDVSTPVAWLDGGSIPFLVPVDLAGALYIDLDQAADSLSLLFELAPPESGWPASTPPLIWAQADGSGAWQTLPAQRDGTQNLRQSGLVRLDLQHQTAGAPLSLRVGYSSGDAALFPLLSGLASNAATASWQGPGGADRLGTPLPAGTISKALAPLPDIAAITQPLASSGGLPRASGAQFDLWLAERLRHKDYGVQSWDYANLVLDAFPTLWQAAVVPVSDGGPGRAPGQVWIVAVPGPDTPLIADPCVPVNDVQVLSNIAAYLTPRISPFVQLNVSNPPYVRLTVHAQLLFKDSEAGQAGLTRLNQELIAFLSPWPTPGLGPRPPNYYTRLEVARFVRQRPYVRAILSLTLDPEPSGRYYFTSAAAHRLELGPTLTLPALPAPARLMPAPAAGEQA